MLLQLDQNGTEKIAGSTDHLTVSTERAGKYFSLCRQHTRVGS